MKATGIVRRIDDLGRVVIPKEIRRNMRIREGDPLEIFVDREGEIILKKYSPVGELSNLAKEYAEALNETLGHPVMIADRDSIVAVSGISKKDFLGKAIGKLIERSMEDRRVYQNTSAGVESALTADDSGETASVFPGKLVTPIIAQGDPVGAVVICGKDTMGDIEKKVAQSAASVIARQMEQ